MYFDVDMIGYPEPKVVKKVKIFTRCNLNQELLEKEINEFIKDVEVEDIQFQESTGGYSAMIIYTEVVE